MKDYNTNEFRKLGITQISVECGCGYAKEDSTIAQTFIIDFEQFIAHRDNPNPTPIVGNSLVSTHLKHRVLEVGTLAEGMEKVASIAKRVLGLIYGRADE